MAQPQSNGVDNEDLEKTKKKKGPSLLRSSCFMVADAADPPPIAGEGGDEAATRRIPTHLVVTVNGLVGSANNWAYAAKQFMKRYPSDVVVLRSECNGAIKTLHGVDIMGKRLADEVTKFVECRPELQKISIVAHSLGGLVARYAIALLYSSNSSNKGEAVNEGKIAGLEPVNFITFATPHLGSRSHRQIPILRGVRALEKVAYHLSWIAGRSGKHLYLKDREKGKPPLLLQMVTDSGGLHFMSALRSFKRHVAYSNYCFDFIVGRKTSSIRRIHEVPKSRNFVQSSKYPHIVYVEKSNITEDDFSDDMIYKAKTTYEMEEAMIKSLKRIPWERIDVSFRKTMQKLFAHSTIQVKTYMINSAGADVISHMIDEFVL
ncbi:alpha/beta-Hydrolases superfamily protein [Rhynchospora pubera]|uniref:Alpha/beta-Hydrolases superfamily protein n=1 Tax=Rhynchospora pubera TaxID=906938 RepID=A0AAV8CIU9_9POAL|nr:alpha/beta-Hydrolases superfamily protein [Rhynchospora pubera]